MIFEFACENHNVNKNIHLHICDSKKFKCVSVCVCLHAQSSLQTCYSRVIAP